MDLDLTRLRHIATIHRLGSFSRAAEELGITQPALSRSVATFEERSGLRLFDRGRGGAVTTTVGKAVLEEVERVLRSVGDLQHNLRLYGSGDAGRVAFGVGPLAASLLLPRLSREVMRTRPNLRLVTSINSGAQLLQDLLAGQIEMILANSWQFASPPEIVATPICTMELAIIVRMEHPLVGKGKVTFADLQRYPVASAVDHSVAELPITAGGFIRENYHILREAVLGSDCTWLAAPTLLSDDIQAGRLCLLEVIDFKPLRNDLSIIRRRDQKMSPAAQVIVDMVYEIFSS